MPADHGCRRALTWASLALTLAKARNHGQGTSISRPHLLFPSLGTTVVAVAGFRTAGRVPCRLGQLGPQVGAWAAQLLLLPRPHSQCGRGALSVLWLCLQGELGGQAGIAGSLQNPRLSMGEMPPRRSPACLRWERVVALAVVPGTPGLPLCPVCLR